MRKKLNRNQISVIYLYLVLLFLLTVVFVPYSYQDTFSPFEEHHTVSSIFASEDSFGDGWAINIHIDHLRWFINLGGISVFFVPLFFIARVKKRKVAK